MTTNSTQSTVSSSVMKTNQPDQSLHLENVLPKTTMNESSGDEDWPSRSPQDPRNWPGWKKNAHILMVAFHSMMGTFMAAGIIPAYDTFAEEYGVSVPQASYLTSFQVCVVQLTIIIDVILELTDSYTSRYFYSVFRH